MGYHHDGRKLCAPRLRPMRRGLDYPACRAAPRRRYLPWTRNPLIPMSLIDSLQLPRWLPLSLLLLPIIGCSQEAGEASPGEEAAGAPEVQVVPNEAENRVDVLVGGELFTAYIYPSTIKKPVLYPIVSATGQTITRG